MTCMSLAIYGFIDRRLRRTVERAGISYETNVVRDQLTVGGDGAPVLARLSDADGDSRDSSPADGSDTSCFDVDDESYVAYLQSLNPTDCKSQDHYRVLGLSQLRYAATDAQIRRAHRLKVLQHHPDKRRARGLPVKSDQEDYFACITRALEQLSNAAKRRAYDSADHTFDDATPAQADLLPDRYNFYDVFACVFERNARWSVNMPVPELGDCHSDRSHVEAFYAFWFDFASWREYSYLDEEDVEKGENREERRWLEKQNMAARKERRKAELKRIRSMVELAYANDPRIAQFREDDRAHKQHQKDSKRAAKEAQRLAEETVRKEAKEAERLVQQRDEEERRAAAAVERQQRDSNKRAFKAERKRLYDFIQRHDYFGRVAAERGTMGEHVELMCTTCGGDPARLAEINARLEDGTVHSEPAARFDTIVEELQAELAERRKELEQQQRRSDAGGSAAAAAGYCSAGWTVEQTQLLVKAVQMFPAGTRNRWEVIAQYVNDHAHDQDGKTKTGKDVVHKVKALQKIEEARAAAGTQQQLVAGKKPVADRLTAEPTSRDAAADAAANGDTADAPWSAAEQRLLEQALRTYASSETDRWDKVAACLPNRSKKQCVARFKELAAQVKAKREAQQKVEARIKGLSTKENVQP